MFDPKQFVSSAADIPGAWIFQHYLGIDSLCGETVRFKSPWSSTGRDSVMLYFDEKKQDYRWRCYSSGKWGDALDYLRETQGTSYGETLDQLKKDYARYLANGGQVQKTLRQGTKWQLKEFSLRQWVQDDAEYWPPFNIGSSTLEFLMVRPLEFFTMHRPATDHSPQGEFSVSGPRIYGYFDQYGKIYKIYQPNNPRGRKFTKIRSYLQGEDQLQGYPRLVITSSLKEIGCLMGFKFKIDYVAPDSENELLSLPKLAELVERHHYREIICLLDNDEAGKRSMARYRDELGIPPCLLPMSKDPSDSVRDFGADAVFQRLVPALDKSFEQSHALNGPAQELVKQYQPQPVLTQKQLWDQPK